MTMPFFDAVVHFACPNANPDQIDWLRAVSRDPKVTQEQFMICAIIAGLQGPNRKSVVASDAKIASRFRRLSRQLLLVHPDGVAGRA